MSLERVRTQRFAEDVAQGLTFVPPRILEMIGPVHFFEGDLHTAGFYPWSMPTEALACAFSPKHFAWPPARPADQRCQTICFLDVPSERDMCASTTLHELGHCLQYALGSYDMSWGWPRYNFVGLPALSGNISTYKEDDYCEQFCEALVAWLLPREELEWRWDKYKYSAEQLLDYAPELLALFNEWAGWPTDRLPRSLQA